MAGTLKVGGVTLATHSDATGLVSMDSGLTFPAGHVIQVQYNSSSTQHTGSTSTYDDVGLSVTITPTYSSSKIFILAQLNVLVDNSGNTGYYEALGAWRILRDATTIQEKEVGFSITSNANAKSLSETLVFSELDLPATTSSIVYKIQSKVGNTAFRAKTNFNTLYASSITQAYAKSTITAMEIST